MVSELWERVASGAGRQGWKGRLSIGALRATLCLIIMGTPDEKLEVLKLLRMVEAHSTYQYAGVSSL